MRTLGRLRHMLYAPAETGYGSVLAVWHGSKHREDLKEAVVRSLRGRAAASAMSSLSGSGWSRVFMFSVGYRLSLEEIRSCLGNV